MEYMILSTEHVNVPDKDALERMVNDFILQGFEPQGGICVRVGTSSGCYFMQAMIRRNSQS